MLTPFVHKAAECMNQIMKIVCKILLFVIKEGYTPGNKSSDKDRIFLAWTFFSIIQCNVRNLLCEPLCQTLMRGKCEHTIPRVTKHRRYKSYQLAHEAHGRNLSARPLFHRTVEKQEVTVKNLGSRWGRRCQWCLCVTLPEFRLPLDQILTVSWVSFSHSPYRGYKLYGDQTALCHSVSPLIFATKKGKDSWQEMKP